LQKLKEQKEKKQVEKNKKEKVMFQNEGSFIFICPEFLNFVLLSAGIFQMFNGIEIDHPVFHILFLNLIFTQISSLINILAFTFEFLIPINIKLSTILNSNNGLTLIFHCCCWAIVSALHYLYIKKKKWLEEHYPDQKQIKNLSMVLLISLYILCAGTDLIVVAMFGWPSYKIFETKYFQKIICITTVLGTYIGLLSISFVFYALIFWKQKSKVNPSKEKNLELKQMSSIVPNENFSNEYGGIWIGETGFENPKSDNLNNCQVLQQ
jgi:hypothetical protein